MTTSQPWWPSRLRATTGRCLSGCEDAVGTYRIHTSRGGAGGGMQRFALSLTAGPTTPALTRRAPAAVMVKISTARSSRGRTWIVFAGNCALESTASRRSPGFAGSTSGAR